MSGKLQWLGDRRRSRLRGVREEPDGQPAVSKTLYGTSVTSHPWLPCREARSPVGGGRGWGGPVAQIPWLPEIKSWSEAYVPWSPGETGNPVLRFRLSRREGELCFWDLLAPGEGDCCPPQNVSLVLVHCHPHLPAFAPSPPPPRTAAGQAPLGARRAAGLMGCEWPTGALQTGAYNKSPVGMGTWIKIRSPNKHFVTLWLPTGVALL